MIRWLVLICIALGCSPATAATRGYTVIGFDRIRVDGPFDVAVRTGLAPSAQAIGSTAALDRLSVEVQNSTLVIKPDTSGWGGYPGEATGKVTIAVTVAGLSSAVLAGSGKLTIDHVRGDKLEVGLGGAGILSLGQVALGQLNIMLTGSGNITIAGHADNGQIVVRGAGNIAGGGLSVNHAEIVSAGAGTVALTATETAKVTAAGTGDVTVLGRPDCTVSAVGAGTVTCGKPQAR
jgi:hypothetical protein